MRALPSQAVQQKFIRNLREILPSVSRSLSSSARDIGKIQEKYSRYDSLLSVLREKDEDDFFKCLQSIYSARNYDLGHLEVILGELHPILKAAIDDLIGEIEASEGELEERFSIIDSYITKFHAYEEQELIRHLRLTQIMTYAVNKLRFLKFPDREEWVNAFEYYKKTNKGWLQEEKLVIEAFRRYGGLSNENADLIFDSYVEEYERFMGPKKMRALLRMRYFVLRGDKWGHIARLRHRVEHGGLGLTMNDIRRRFRKEAFMKRNKPSPEEVDEFIKYVYDQAISAGVL